VYFCNGASVGQAQDDGAGGLTVVGHALDLETDDRVNCLSDDGTYLVAGVTKNTTVDPATAGHSKIIFWDTNQSSWQREWPIPDSTIIAIRRIGTAMIAVTPNGLFAFSFTSPPQQILPYFASSSFTPDYNVPGQSAVDVLGEAILFGGNDIVSTFGKLTPAMPNAFFQPFSLPTTNEAVTLVVASSRKDRMWVGTNGNKLYRIPLDVAGSANGQSAETIFIDLKRWWQVGRIVVEFEGQLTDDDTFVVDMRPDDASQYYFAGQVAANNGGIRVKEMYTTLEAKTLSLKLTWGAGAARIASISAYGDPIETPTHSRDDVGIPD
jgi:hypothetical protein